MKISLLIRQRARAGQERKENQLEATSREQTYRGGQKRMKQEQSGIEKMYGVGLPV
jgi:pyoverdine/dityrosine biosynthesis protein Dit1